MATGGRKRIIVMRKSTIIRNWLFGMALFAMPAMAQDVPNGDFSSWEDRSLPEAVGDGSYSRPTGGWDCLNSLAPGSCTKTEGRTAGSSAALLTTKKFMVNMGSGPTVLYTSIMMLGDFLTAFSSGQPSFGIPFTGQPKTFSFWYKYLPVTGDKGRVYIKLWKGDEHEPTSKWRQSATFTQTVNEWTKVEIDLTKGDENGLMLNFTPENMYIEATSSLSYMSQHTSDDVSGVTEEGSQLYITDMAFQYVITPAITSVSINNTMNNESSDDNVDDKSGSIKVNDLLTAFVMNKWSATTKGDVSELWMDYAIYTDNTVPVSSDWKRLNASKIEDDTWAYTGSSINVLEGLQSNTVYCLEICFKTNYNETFGANACFPTDGQNIVLKFMTGDLSSAVNAILASPQSAGPRYNLNGQQVNQDYKGVVLENDRKILVK